MNAEGMLKVRGWFEEAIVAFGGEVTGAGVNLQEPVTYIDFSKDGHDFNVSIRFRGAHSDSGGK